VSADRLRGVDLLRQRQINPEAQVGASLTHIAQTSQPCAKRHRRLLSDLAQDAKPNGGCAMPKHGLDHERPDLPENNIAGGASCVDAAPLRPWPVRYCMK
jgi:hypothetical protein